MLDERYAAMAKVLAERLTDDELVRLSKVMSEDDDHMLWVEVNKILRERHPQMFGPMHTE